MTINGERWRILFVSSWHSALLTDQGFYTLGVCDDDSKTIYVSLNLSKAKLKKVLCHELVHAAMFSYNIDMSLEQEEMVADLIATFGHEIIRNTNKVFFDVI